MLADRTFGRRDDRDAGRTRQLDDDRCTLDQGRVGRQIDEAGPRRDQCLHRLRDLGRLRLRP